MPLDELTFAQEQARLQRLAGLVDNSPATRRAVPMKAGVQMDRVAPELRNAVENMVRDNPYGARITSGFRTYEEQAKLYNSNNPYPVAPPGKSKHNHGNAVDASGSPQAVRWFAENAHKYGLHQPVKNDPVHFELMGNAQQSVGQNFFNSIIRAEGTAAGGRDPYNTSLGYMQSPRPLTSMTMKEVLAWGEQVRAAQGLNSSAKGAFQIVNTTQRTAMAALGIGENEVFSPENQRRMAVWIAKTQGLGAWEGLKLHKNEMTNAQRAFPGVNDNDIKNAGWNGKIANNAQTSGPATVSRQKNADDFAHGLSLATIWDSGLQEFMKSATNPDEEFLRKQYENMLTEATTSPNFTPSYQGMSDV